jgi:hypothetical protein
MHLAAEAFIRWEMGALDSRSDPLDLLSRICSEPMGAERRPTVYAYASEVAAALTATEPARQLYDAFSPWQGQLVVGGMGEACMGAVDRFLGMLSAAVGRWEEADSWFRSAAALEERVSSPPLLARTRYWHARMLAAREGPGDHDGAVILLERASLTTGTLGMKRLHRQVCQLLTTLK